MDVLTPPKPLESVFYSQPPSAPTKPASMCRFREQLSPTTTMKDATQTVRRQLFSYPVSELEETEIDDLFTDTREKKIEDILHNRKGETIVLFDDGTYELITGDLSKTSS